MTPEAVTVVEQQLYHGLSPEDIAAMQSERDAERFRHARRVERNRQSRFRRRDGSVGLRGTRAHIERSEAQQYRARIVEGAIERIERSEEQALKDWTPELPEGAPQTLVYMYQALTTAQRCLDEAKRQDDPQDVLILLKARVTAARDTYTRACGLHNGHGRARTMYELHGRPNPQQVTLHVA